MNKRTEAQHYLEKSLEHMKQLKLFGRMTLKEPTIEPLTIQLF